MRAFDIDGVLAAPPPGLPRAWGKMNGEERAAHQRNLVRWYGSAPTLLKPSGEFMAITARRNYPEVERATREWLATNYPDCRRVCFLTRGRNTESIVAHKAAVIERYRVDEYTDDQLGLLRRLAAIVTADLWHWRGGMSSPVAVERR